MVSSKSRCNIVRAVVRGWFFFCSQMSMFACIYSKYGGKIRVKDEGCGRIFISPPPLTEDIVLMKNLFIVEILCDEIRQFIGTECWLETMKFQIE